MTLPVRKLRLLLFEACNRNCAGCCNKDWDLKALPVCESFEGWSEVFLTGGEPMLNPDLIVRTAKAIPHTTRVYLYTAKVDNILDVTKVLRVVDGLTVTLHEQSDVEPFLELNRRLSKVPREICPWSLRLNVFKGVALPDVDMPLWKVKSDIEWIKDCPLPEGETLMRLK